MELKGKGTAAKGSTMFDSRVLFTMHNASCKDLSISSSMKSFAPLSIMETCITEMQV
jgi:hypothetical protein